MGVIASTTYELHGDLVAEHEGGSVLELWKAIESQHLTKDTSLRHQAWTLLFALRADDPLRHRYTSQAMPHTEPHIRPICTLASSATLEKTMDGQDTVIEGTNPGTGPITGGLEIWIYGSNLPDDSRPLYARFGDNVTRVVSAN